MLYLLLLIFIILFTFNVIISCFAFLSDIKKFSKIKEKVKIIPSNESEVEKENVRELE